MSSGPRIVIVLPRNMAFGPARATSIDLCVHDFVAASRHRQTTTVVCDRMEQPFADVAVRMVERGAGGQGLHAVRLALAVRALRPDLVVCQQHQPTAAVLTRLVSVPVVLHTHNDQKPARHALGGWQRRGQYRRLAGMVFVSQASCARFETVWGPLGRRRAVVHNGLDMAAWRPAPERAPMVLLAARAAPEKGVLPAVEALAAVLPRHPGWRARLILNETRRHPGYMAAIRAVTAGQPERFEVLTDQPFTVVKASNEAAAVALVPSQWHEPFGRTALEALAGGACLISSGMGGLAEIGEGVSVPIDPHEPGSITAALEHVLADASFRSDLARRGRLRAKTLFDIGTVSARLDAVYDAVLGG